MSDKIKFWKSQETKNIYLLYINNRFNIARKYEHLWTNKRPSKYMKPKLTELKGEIVLNNEDFKMSLSIMGRTIRQGYIKKIESLNNTINQLDLSDIHTLHTSKKIYCSQGHMGHLLPCIRY
jgi:hypothetical protein